MGQIRSEQGKTGQDGADQSREEPGEAGQSRTGQIRLKQGRAGRVGQIRVGQGRAGLGAGDRTGQGRAEPGREPGHDRTGQGIRTHPDIQSQAGRQDTTGQDRVPGHTLIHRAGRGARARQERTGYQDTP